jgi:hypothetical protein
VFGWNGTAWVQLGDDIDGEAECDNSGYSVSLAAGGDVVAIGAKYNEGNGAFSGHVRVFGWKGTAWVQLGDDIDGEAENDYSGISVSLAAGGDVVAIGAHGNDGNGARSGHVRVFGWKGTAWVQLGDDIDGEAEGDNSGYLVSLAAGGDVVAIGAYGNGGNGAYSGHVRVFGWNDTAWVQIGDDIDGEAESDYSGVSVSLAAGGDVVAIGAEGNDSNGAFSGHVRTYQIGCI